MSAAAEEEIEIPSLLVAMPNLGDAVFSQSVVLLSEYTAEYAYGFIINQPSGSKVKDIFKADFKLGCDPETPLLVGGPVQLEFIWVLHSHDISFKSSKNITEKLVVSTFMEFNSAALAGQLPRVYHIGFGYAGWGAGQLDQELQQGSWWLTEMDHQIMLNLTYAERWKASLDKIGISPQVSFHTTGEA